MGDNWGILSANDLGNLMVLLCLVRALVLLIFGNKFGLLDSNQDISTKNNGGNRMHTM